MFIWYERFIDCNVTDEDLLWNNISAGAKEQIGKIALATIPKDVLPYRPL